jgi:hypothetical protein
MSTTRAARGVVIVLLLVAPARTAVAQRADAVVTWDSVGAILQTAPVVAAGYVRYNFPRRDLTLRVRDVIVNPGLALGAWLGFAGTPSASVVMGDIVLPGDELGPALAELVAQGIDVTAIHNHVVGEPQIAYVHVHAMGPAMALATKFDKVLARTHTPRPVVAVAAPPVTIDTALVFRTLGLTGRASGTTVSMSVVIPTVTVTMHGLTVVPAQGYGTPINVQMVNASRYVATGDYSVLGDRVQSVLRVLAANGITATAVHSHMIGETPKIYYIHFWADGAPQTVLNGLRAALDAGR